VSELEDDRSELAESDSESDRLQKSLDEARIREKDVYDQLLRLMAEFENYRKRTDARVSDARKTGKLDVLTEIISLSDVLAQATSSSQHATDVESLKRGFNLVGQQFEKFLKDQGLVPIRSKGEKLASP
jgi:molecular chaperone GrpE